VRLDAGRSGARGRAVIGWGAGFVVVVIALLAAQVSRTGKGPAFEIELLAARWSNLLGGAAAAVPVGYAFSAGMLAAVNPCGFACLPAYLGLFLRSEDRGLGIRALLRALLVSATMTGCFVALFGLVGILVGAFSAAVASYFPAAGLAVGLLMVLAGSRLLTGGMLYGRFAEQAADRLGGVARRSSLLGYAGFGAGYGLASLGCTLPIFLTVVGSALVARGFVAALLQFVLYALGMGLVLAVITLTVALLKRAVLRPARIAARYVTSASAMLLLFTGGYVVYYWLTQGGLLASVLRG
jgi:cytochrome c-type biogenesis protein